MTNNADSTIHTTPRVFIDTVDRHGNQVALRYKALGLWHDMSWTSYFNKARALSLALMEMGLEKGDCVAIIGDNCPEWVLADMGIQCAGGVSVGIYATNAWPQVHYIVDHCRAKFFFVENEEQLDKWLYFKEKATTLQKVIIWDTEGLRTFNDPMVMTFDALMDRGEALAKTGGQQFHQRMDSVLPEDLAVLIYTSGTTGPPKGAMLTHTNVTWMAHAVARTNPVHPNDEVLSFLPLCHIFERLFSVFIHITHAYTVNFVERPDTVADNMVEVSPTLGYAVPRIWEKYYSSVMIRMADATWFKRLIFRWALSVGRKQADRRMAFQSLPLTLRVLSFFAHWAVFRKLKERLGFERIRVAYSGAAPISPEVLHFFQAIGINLIEGYGQTEGTGVTTLSPIGKAKSGYVGLPLKETELRIAGDGEILVRSPGVFVGYYQNPEGSREALVDGWLHTGDVGEIDRDGYLKITDRKKDIIVTAGGKNITPQYIENKLKASIYINDAVVIGDRRKYLSALIVIDEDNVIKFAQDNKVPFSTYKDLTQTEAVNKLIHGEIQKVNAGLARVETIRKFTIIPKKLYEEDGEVTPTMKVKRKYINEAFNDLIDAMY
jgi:long-chain acyl-CoA synthetase